MRKLNWFECGNGADRFLLKKLESALECKFPEDFLDFAIENAGASNPDESAFEIILSNGHKFISNFGSLLGVCGTLSTSILSVLSDLGDQLPSKVIPVVATGSGDFICLDFRQSGETPIVYYCHDKIRDESITKIANTFTEFLNLLYEPNDP